MFRITAEDEDTINLYGRFDASQSDKATNFFADINQTTRVNFENLDYISSAGLGVLVSVQKRLKTDSKQLILYNMNNHIRDILEWARFDLIFELEWEIHFI